MASESIWTGNAFGGYVSTVSTSATVTWTYSPSGYVTFPKIYGKMDNERALQKYLKVDELQELPNVGL